MKIVRRLVVIAALLAISVLAAYLLLYRYENTTSSVSIQENELSGELRLNPATMIIPHAIQLDWTLAGSDIVTLLDYQFVENTDSRSIAAYCSRTRFDIVSHNLSYGLSPFVWADPANVLLLAITLGSLLSILGMVFVPFITQAAVTRLSEAFDVKKMQEKSFWERKGVFWQRLALLLIVWLTLPIMLFPSCLVSDTSSLIGSLLVAYTGIFALLALVISFFKPAFLSKLLQGIAEHIPYPVTVALVLIYWGLCYASILGKNAFVVLELVTVVMCVGLVILWMCQNKEDKTLTLSLPTSPLSRLLSVGLAAIISLFLYFSPWLSLLHNVFLQTFFGLGLFLLPGTLCAILLLHKGKAWHQLLVMGFVFSLLLATVFGYLGIVLGLSAISIQIAFVAVGIVALVYLLLKRGSFEVKIKYARRVSFSSLFFFSAAIFSALILWATAINAPPINDFVSYNAMVTEFAQSPHYSVSDPFLGTSNLMTSRFWLVTWTVAQALIVNFSKLNIMYAMSDLAGLLALLLVVAIYDLFTRFQLPNIYAFLAIIFTAYAVVSQTGLDQVGLLFSESLLHDKTFTAWILTPIMVALSYDLIRERSAYNIVLLALAAFTAVNCHATSFFYAALLSGIVVCLDVLLHPKQWLNIVIVSLIFGLCILIPLALREISPDIYEFDGGTVTRLPDYHRPRLDLSEDDEILGISPRLRNGPAFWLMYAAGAVALLTFRKQVSSYYVLAGCLLILLVSNPVTAPLIARAVTPYHLWRATWFVPLGVGAALFFWGIAQILSKRAPQLATMVLAEVVVLVLVTTANGLIVRPHQLYYPLEEFVTIGENIPDNSSSHINVLTNPDFNLWVTSLNTWIPSIAWNLNPIIMREGTYSFAGLSDEEGEQRNADLERLFADDLSLAEMRELIDKYEIQYIILVKGVAAADHLQALISESPKIQFVASSENYMLWQIEAIP